MTQPTVPQFIYFPPESVVYAAVAIEIQGIQFPLWPTLQFGVSVKL